MHHFVARYTGQTANYKEIALYQDFRGIGMQLHAYQPLARVSRAATANNYQSHSTI
jgi:hypothetical protein